MKRLSRKLTLALAALFWIAALLYFILLNSRKILPDQRNEQPQVKEVSDTSWYVRNNKPHGRNGLIFVVSCFLNPVSNSLILILRIENICEGAPLLLDSLPDPIIKGKTVHYVLLFLFFKSYWVCKTGQFSEMNFWTYSEPGG